MNQLIEISEKEINQCISLDNQSINLWTKTQWINEFKKDNIKAFGFFKNKKMIGACIFEVILDEANLNYISVAIEFRKKGIGRSLVNAFINVCHSLKVKKIILEVSTNNNSALAFYESLGFINIGFRPNYYKDGSDALIKEKKC